MTLRELPLLAPPAAAASPLSGRLVFVLAPPGSGAEIVEAALRAAGAGGRGVPSGLVAEGLGEVLNNFALGATPDDDSRGPVGSNGVSVLAGPQPVLEALRALGDAVLATDAAVIVEHSPEHARWAPFLAAIYPDATYVHVVRDGRRLLAAAGDDLVRAADDWAVVGRRILDLPAGITVRRVRIEDLRADPTRIVRLVDDLGLGDGDAAAAAVRSGLERLSDPDVTPAVTAAVGSAAGDVLAVLGYDPDRVGA
jgi:hypothetical protein